MLNSDQDLLTPGITPTMVSSGAVMHLIEHNQNTMQIQKRPKLVSKCSHSLLCIFAADSPNPTIKAMGKPSGERLLQTCDNG